MLPLHFSKVGKRLRVLCIGAHSDDIEIGCSGTLMALLGRGYKLDVTWAVLSASGARATEARRSAKALLRRAASLQLLLGGLSDSHFPAEFAKAKKFMNEVRDSCEPDVLFTHWLDDRHQDHRLVGELTWQTWRDHLILEYDIPKFEGDLFCPNAFVPLSRLVAERKANHLMRHFGSQRAKYWFTSDTFMALSRLRGVACRSESGYAEGFNVRKILL